VGYAGAATFNGVTDDSAKSRQSDSRQGLCYDTERKRSLDPKAFLTKVGPGRAVSEYRKKATVFVQGDPADAIFHIQKGKVKLTVVSDNGKEAIIAILANGDFVGEGCLAGRPLYLGTATAITDCSILRLQKSSMMRLLHEEPAFSELFVSYLLSRNIRIEEDLVDQLFNSSEKRLARVLLLLANFGKEGKPEPVIPKISQETLAEMIGLRIPTKANTDSEGNANGIPGRRRTVSERSDAGISIVQ
jgi:CRP/FNR family cyclic AMP-dependent transcriptional regulator